MQRSSQPTNTAPSRPSPSQANLAQQPLRQEVKAPAERKALHSVQFKSVVTAPPLSPTLTALGVTKEPICFPANGDWKPIMQHLWGLDVREGRGIHLFDQVKQTEALIEPLEPLRQDGVEVFYQGFGFMDDCLVAITVKGQLEFWKYQDDHMTMVSSMQIKLRKGQIVYFVREHPVPVQRLSPNHIGVLANVINGRGPITVHKLFVIDTNDNSQKEYELPHCVSLVFRPSKASPLKHYLLAQHSGNVQVIEINLGWRLRWSWFANLGTMTFKMGPDQKRGALAAVSSSHIVTTDFYTDSAPDPFLTGHNHLFSINEEDGRLTLQLMHTFKLCYRKGDEWENKLTLFRSGCIYQSSRDRFQWIDFSDFSFHELVKLDGPRSALYGENVFCELSDTELAAVRRIRYPTPISNSRTILTCHESLHPAQELAAAQEVKSYLASKAKLPDVLGSLVAEYAFTFFAQKKASEMQGIAQRKADCAAKERKKEEERGMAPLSLRSL